MLQLLRWSSRHRQMSMMLCRPLRLALRQARKHAADAYLLALPEERCVAEEAAGGIFVDPVTKERNLLISPYTEAEKAARRRAAVDEASEGEGEAAETMEEEEE